MYVKQKTIMDLNRVTKSSINEWAEISRNKQEQYLHALYDLKTSSSYWPSTE